jgi:hypothetical protein
LTSIIFFWDKTIRSTFKISSSQGVSGQYDGRLQLWEYSFNLLEFMKNFDLYDKAILSLGEETVCEDFLLQRNV